MVKTKRSLSSTQLIMLATQPLPQVWHSLTTSCLICVRFHCSDWARAGWASRKPEGALPWNSSLCFDVTVILSGFPLPAMPQFRASSPLERYHLYSRVRGNGVWFGFGGETRIHSYFGAVESSNGDARTDTSLTEPSLHSPALIISLSLSVVASRIAIYDGGRRW